MATYNLGNVAGLIRGQLAPDKKYVLWGKILNPSFPDLVEINYWDDNVGSWTPVTDPTTQHWLRPVKDNTITAPPGSPAEGDRYMIPTGATGAWSGKAGQITTYRSSAWIYQIPLDGFIVSVRTEANKLYDFQGVYGSGGDWVENDFQVPIAPNTYVPYALLGVNNGIATLNVDGKVPAAQIEGTLLPYTPAVSGSWPGGTNTVKQALDYLITNAGGSGGTVTTLSTGNLAQLFTAAVSNAATTPALAFTPVQQAINTVFAGPASGGSANPTFRSLVAADIPNLDAAKISSGTIDIARMPAGVLERVYVYAGGATTPETAGLTLSNVQNGDIVKITATGLMYVVTNDADLTSAASFTAFTVGSAAAVPWSGITSKPTIGNGLIETGGTLRLGGSMLANTSITGGNFTMSWGTTGSRLSKIDHFIAQNSGPGFTLSHNDGTLSHEIFTHAGSTDAGASLRSTGVFRVGRVHVQNNGTDQHVSMEGINSSGHGSGNIGTTFIRILTNNNISISGSHSGFTGMSYAADYSANYTARTLADKGYVDTVGTNVGYTDVKVRTYLSTLLPAATGGGPLDLSISGSTLVKGWSWGAVGGIVVSNDSSISVSGEYTYTAGTGTTKVDMMAWQSSNTSNDTMVWRWANTTGVGSTGLGGSFAYYFEDNSGVGNTILIRQQFTKGAATTGQYKLLIGVEGGSPVQAYTAGYSTSSGIPTNQFHSPVQVPNYTTGSLPTASAHPYGIAIDTTTGSLKASIGGSWIQVGAGTLTGTGVTNSIPMWTSTTALGTGTGFTWDNTNRQVLVETIKFGGPSGALTGSAGQVTWDSTLGDLKVYLSSGYVPLTQENQIVVSSGTTAITLDETYRNATVYTLAATLVTVTAPDSLPTGFRVRFVKVGAGNVQVVPSGGSSLVASSDTITTQYASAILSKRAAATWSFYGSIGTAGAGISNAGVANEIVKSNGTNVVGTGLFQSSSNTLDLGSDSITSGTARSIMSKGTEANIDFNVYAKGTGQFKVQSSDFVWGSALATSLRTLSFTGTAADVSVSYITKGTGIHRFVGGGFTDAPFEMSFATGVATLLGQDKSSTGVNGTDVVFKAGNNSHVTALRGGDVELLAGTTGNGAQRGGRVVINSLEGLSLGKEGSSTGTVRNIFAQGSGAHIGINISGKGTDGYVTVTGGAKSYTVDKYGMVVGGNLSIGTYNPFNSADNNMVYMASTTAPVGNPTAGVFVYGKDTNSIGELYVRNTVGTDFNISGLMESVLLAGTSLTLSDALHRGKIIYCTAATTITITANNTLPMGFNCLIVQDGAGVINMAMGAGATMRGKAATTAAYDMISFARYKANEFIGG